VVSAEQPAAWVRYEGEFELAWLCDGERVMSAGDGTGAAIVVSPDGRECRVDIGDEIKCNRSAYDHPATATAAREEVTRMDSEHLLRRLLVLNSYGFTVEHHDDGPKPLDSGEAFLSDEWLEKWYGKDVLPDYVWEELSRVGS
jgi:hypothetical protein